MSIVVAFAAAALGVIVGGFLGSIVGFVRGRTETVTMSLVDVILASPALVPPARPRLACSSDYT